MAWPSEPAPARPPGRSIGPRLPRLLVPRPRLVARLELGLPLTVVRAPLGFGKTTLLGQWLRNGTPDTDEVAVWLRLSPEIGGDGFWPAVLEAGQAAGAFGAHPRPAESPRSRVQRALSAAPHPVTLVLDAFDHVSADGVEPDLLALLRELSGFNLVVALRGQHRFRPARLVDIDHVVLTADELAFTADETHELLRLGGLIAPSAAGPQLHAQTGGWPEPTRAVVLALAAAPERGPDDVVAEVSVEFTRERLVPELGGPERLAVALTTSLLDPITPELAETLTDPAIDARARLGELVADGLLRAETRDGQRVLRWSTAIRSAFYAEAVRRDPDRVRGEHRVAARWYLDTGLSSPALHHAIEARDWDMLVRIIEVHWGALLLGDRDGLLAAFATTPTEVVERSLICRLARAIVLNAPDEAILNDLPLLPADPEQLDELGRGGSGPADLEIALAAMVILRTQGRLAQASEQAGRLAIFVDSVNAVHTSAVAHRVPGVLLQAGITHLQAGNLDEARLPLQRAHHLVAPGSGSYVSGGAAGKLAMIMSMQGWTANSELWLREYDAAPHPLGWVNHNQRSNELAARIWSALDQLDLAVATTLIADMRNDLVQVRQGDWPVIAYVEALYGLHTGQSERALPDLVRAVSGNHSLLERGALAHVLTGSMRVELLLALGRADQARAGLETLPDHPLVRIARARLALLGADSAQVLGLADDYQWFNTAPPRLAVEMLVLKAVAHQRNSQPATATATLGNAVRAATTHRLRRPFATVPRAELLEIAGGLSAAAIEFLMHPTLTAALVPYPAELAVVALTERERLIVGLMADGRRAQQIAGELFLSYNTVRTYQRQIYRKLGASSQAEAVSRARAYGLLPSR